MNFFRRLYLRVFTWWTFLLLGWATSNVHKLLIMSGKDPNFVPLPPTPTPPIEEAANTFNGRRPMPNIWSFGKEWVKDPSKHPVIQSRLAYEAKKTAQTVSVTQADNSEPNKHEEIKESIIDSNAFEAIREAVSNVEKSLKN